MENGDIQSKELMMKVIGICYGIIVAILIIANPSQGKIKNIVKKYITN